MNRDLAFGGGDADDDALFAVVGGCPWPGDLTDGADDGENGASACDGSI